MKCFTETGETVPKQRLGGKTPGPGIRSMHNIQELVVETCSDLFFSYNPIESVHYCYIELVFCQVKTIKIHHFPYRTSLTSHVWLVKNNHLYFICNTQFVYRVGAQKRNQPWFCYSLARVQCCWRHLVFQRVCLINRSLHCNLQVYLRGSLYDLRVSLYYLRAWQRWIHWVSVY